MMSSFRMFVLCIFYYKLHLGLKMCKIMVMKSDGHIIIDKLWLVLNALLNESSCYDYCIMLSSCIIVMKNIFIFLIIW